MTLGRRINTRLEQLVARTMLAVLDGLRGLYVSGHDDPDPLLVARIDAENHRRFPDLFPEV